MINCVLCYHNYLLSIASVGYLVRFVFVGTLEVEVMELKKWIILMLRRQLTNRG
jgi:hypothetical protein